MSNSFCQQLSKHSTARSSYRLLNRCGLFILGSGWIVAIAIAGMGATNFCFSGKEAGYSSTSHEDIIQSSKPQFSVPFWIYLLLIVGASPWLFTYLSKRSIANNSKKPIRSGLRSPSSVPPIAKHTSRQKEWQGVLPRSSREIVPPVNSRSSSQPVSFISQEQKPVSYRISRGSSRSSSAVLSNTFSVGAKNIRLPFEQLK